MAKSQELLITFVENVIYGHDLDGALKASLCRSRECATIMTTAPFNEFVTEIEEALHKELSDAGDEDTLKVEESEDEAMDCDNISPDSNMLKETLKDDIDSASVDKKTEIEAFGELCARKLEMFVTLEVEPDDKTALTDRIKQTEVNNQRLSSEKGYVMVVYDMKCAGEASAQPNIRVPPLRGNGDHMRSLVSATLHAYNSTGTELGPRDMFVTFDGFKPGHPNS